MTDLIVKAFVDWDNNGNFTTTGDDISTYLQSCSIIIGISDPSDTARIADIGTCQLELDNRDRVFSPDNSGGTYFGKLLPNLPVKVEAHYGVSSWTIFRGITRAIRPNADQYGNLRATIECEDLLSTLQDTNISLPLVENVTADYLLRWIGSAVFRTAQATATLTYTANVEQGDQVIIDGTTYEYADAVGTDKVLIGATKEDSAQNLIDAINKAEGSGTTYGSSLERQRFTASISGAVVTITAYARGAWGNAITISTSINQYHLHQNPTVTVGSIVSGSYLDTREPDGVSLVLAETTGTPGFDYQFDIVDVNGTALTLEMLVQYNGNVAHVVNVDAFNWTTVGYDNVGTIPSGASLVERSYTLTSDHTDGSGNVRIRIQHVSAGNVTHQLIIDHFYLTSTIPDTVDQITLSGSTLSGGIDGPAGLIDYDAGDKTFDQAGDMWQEGETSGLTAASDPVLSEFGLMWAARDGSLTFRNLSWWFKQYTVTPALTISNDHTGQDGALTIDEVYTRSAVTYRPRAESTTQVVAKANAPIFIPATIVTATRFNPSSDKGTGSNKVVTIPYVQTGTSETIGAKDLILPLVPETDYLIYGTKDRQGPEVSSLGLVTFAAAPTGSGIELQIGNSVARSGWAHDVQIRGKALQAFDPVQIIIDDSTSQALYGRRELPYTLNLTSNDIENFAQALGEHLLYSNNTPIYRTRFVEFEGAIEVNGVNIYSLDIGDVISVTETQTAITSQLYTILGIGYVLVPGANPQARFTVRRVGDVPYWILEDADSELGVNTYLGV